MNDITQLSLIPEIVETENYNIISAQSKAKRLILTHSTPTCSISGGSDSDIMFDMIYRADPTKKVKYYFCDTGLEYQATKEHLAELENKYGIKIDSDLDMIGVRKAEGGIRSLIYKNCFTACDNGCDAFRPVFWFTDTDKKEYEATYGVDHSKCYTEYGMKRTGCVGCPFNIYIVEELDIIQRFEPRLYKAAVAVFGKSYEYTSKYREFVKMMKTKEKQNENQLRLE